MGSANEHHRRRQERTRYAERQLRANRADPSQKNVGGTRDARRAEHVDRANPRGPSLPDADVPNSKRGSR